MIRNPSKCFVLGITIMSVGFVFSFQIRYCNRGFCYTKQVSASKSEFAPHTTAMIHDHKYQPAPSRRSGLDFCTDGHGYVQECEMMSILGSFKDIENINESPFPNKKRTIIPDFNRKDRNSYRIKNLNENRNGKERNYRASHVSWKEKPQRGHCFDSETGYAFDCNLIEVLDDGRVLIEDLRAGGVLVAQPKTEFSMKRNSKISRSPKTPEVMNGSGPCNPTEDFRTNILLNLEGM